MARWGRSFPIPRRLPKFYLFGAGVTAVLTGTATAGITEADVVAGGKTIIITLTGDTWAANGATFDAERQAIIDGIAGNDSDQLQDGLAVGDVVRTSDAVCTITFSAIPGFNIASLATYAVTVPGSAVVGGSPVVATPTFTVSAIVVGGFKSAWAQQSNCFIGNSIGVS